MKIFTSKLLPDVALIHAFTCKTSHNIAFHVGDNTHDVIQHRKTLASTLNYPHDRLVSMKQIHSDKVVAVTATHHHKAPVTCDALITNEPNTPLMVMTADCTPVLLYDRHTSAVAAIHAGRAGALSNIIANTLTKMAEQFHSDSRNIIAVLGPSICQKCYEVNQDIYEETLALGYDSAVMCKAQRYYLHVNTILVQQLQECGVTKNHIDVMKHCTACEHHTFFSYRAQKGNTGRQAGIIMLRSSLS